MLPGSGAGPRAEGHGGSGYWKEGARQPGWKATKSGEVPGRKRPLGSSGLFSGRREIDLLFQGLGSLR